MSKDENDVVSTKDYLTSRIQQLEKQIENQTQLVNRLTNDIAEKRGAIKELRNMLSGVVEEEED